MLNTVLNEYKDPYTGVNLLSTSSIKSLTESAHEVTVELQLGYPFLKAKHTIAEALQRYLTPFAGDKKININLSMKINSFVGIPGKNRLANIKNIIVVGSGKGGVGKSTVSANLALALSSDGANVGLLDADVYGPSQPLIFGTNRLKPIIKENRFQPISNHGVQTMSIGYLIDEDAPMVWRGPMLGKAIEQMLIDTEWDNLDYLIVDLPPGTGDVQLTLCQKMPISAAIVVTTPQDLAMLDVRRAVKMFQKLNVPILGVIENMSYHLCSQCGHIEDIFGEDGGKKLADEFSFPLLGQIPLHQAIRKSCETGTPLVVSHPDSDYAMAFFEAARKGAAALTKQTKDYSSKFPKIVVKHG